MTTTANTTAFTLDPTLPWLFSDPAMQCPEAFRNMQTITLNDQPWEPMGLYFPAGAQLAMCRVTSLDQLVEGAAYWSEMSHYEESRKAVVTRYKFGRYVGPAYPESVSTPRRWKKGEAHLKLESDVLDCDLRSYYLHEDGTQVAFIDVKADVHRLYQITHYVDLPASLLAELGPSAVKQSGLTLRQATWLRQEQELLKEAVEITSQIRGGLKLPNYRVVLPQDRLGDFLTLQDGCPQLTASQAKKLKSGTIAITYRTRRKAGGGGDYLVTEHYKQEDAASLLDWLQSHSELQRLQLSAAISQQQVAWAAETIRAKQAAERQTQEAAQALQQAQEAEQALRLRDDFAPVRHQYAGLRELALAA